MSYDSSKSSFICGGLASMTSIVIVFPLHKTTFFQQLHGISFISAVRQMHSEKFNNLYRGVLPPLMQKTMSLSIMFGVYDKTEKRLLLGGESGSRRTRAFSAMCAGMMEATLVPFERIQTLLQNQKSHIRFRNTFHAFQGILFQGHGGVRELYRGFFPCILRNCLGNTTYFVLREEIFGLIPVSEQLPGHSGSFKRLLRDFLTGALLGAGIGALTFPLNVTKTQMQSQLSTPNSPRRPGWLATLANIYRDRGYRISAIYRGVPVNCMRSMLSWGIITMAYDFYITQLFQT